MARTKRSKTSTPSQSQSVSSKKVRIVEPSEEEETVAPLVRSSRSSQQPKSIMKKDKGKAPISSSSVPAQSAAQASDSDTESISPGSLISSMKKRRKARLSGPGESSKKVTELVPPEGFVTSTLYITDHTDYELKYKNRDLCPGIYVNLEEIKALGIDVTEYLEHYRKLIEINMPYSPEMIRIFYNNMKSNSLKDGKGTITHHSLITKIRGVDINITADDINDYLGTHEFEKDLKNHSEQEMFELLKPGEEYPGNLSFEPSSMPVLQRTIHYIYSRCLVNKSKNYTHLAHGDYHFLASILAKEKRNIGQFVFNEMWRFRFSNSKRMTMPYPCLISRILELHQVWYIVEKVEKPIMFSEQHFHRMNIDVISVQPREAPKKKKRATSATSQGQDEAHSSAPPQPSSAPSFAQAALQTYLETEFRRMGEKFMTSFQAQTQEYMRNVLTAAGEYFSGRTLDVAVTSLSKDLVMFRDAFLEKFDALQATVTGLDRRVESIEQFIREYQASTSAPPPPPSRSPEDPPTEAVLAMIDFSSSILNPEPQPIPAPPESSSEPQPSSIPEPSSPPISSSLIPPVD